MGNTRPTASWLAVVIAALIGMVAVIWLPVMLPASVAHSPLPLAEDAASSLPPLAELGLTLLVVGVGAGVGAGVVWITLYRRRQGE
jgi:hypothetical protein